MGVPMICNLYTLKASLPTEDSSVQSAVLYSVSPYTNQACQRNWDRHVSPRAVVA